MRHFRSIPCVVLAMAASAAAQEPRARAVLTGHGEAAWHLAISPAGRLLASCGEPVVKVWDVATGKEVATFESPNDRWARAVAFAPDGKRLAFRWDSGAIQLWDPIRKGDAVALGPDAGEGTALAFSPDSRILAFSFTPADDRAPDLRGTGIKLWDLEARKELTVLTGHAKRITALAFCPDGATLASASFDGSVRLWDLGSRMTRAILEGHKGAVESLAIAPDGKTAASGDDDGAIKLWDVATGELKSTWKRPRARITALAFTPNGKTLASTSNDNRLRLWDTATGQERPVVKVPGGTVRGVAFTRDGRIMATGNADGTIRLWDMPPRDQAEAPDVRHREVIKGTIAHTPEDHVRIIGKVRVIDGNAAPTFVKDGPRVVRIVGAVDVLDAHTLRFADGTLVELNGGMDAPELDQLAALSDALYPWGVQAADYLRALIRGRAVTCHVEGRRADRFRGDGFVDETQLQLEMVRAGWAVSRHSGMDGWEMFAREGRRGVWRGRFVRPEDWRKGDRLSGEPGETTAQRESLAALKPFDPIVTFDETRPGRPVIAIRFHPNTSQKPGDDDLARLKSFPNLRSLDLPSASKVTDAGLKHLTGLDLLVELNLNWTSVTAGGVVDLVKGRLMLERLEISGVPFRDEDLAAMRGVPDIQTLSLRSTRITDAGLVKLKRFEKLRSLSLMDTAIGDAGLVHLEPLTSLEDLDLDRTVISDVGLVHLKALPRLRRLQLAHTAVTDAGLVHLRALPALEDLNVRGTRVTREAAEALRSRRP